MLFSVLVCYSCVVLCLGGSDMSADVPLCRESLRNLCSSLIVDEQDILSGMSEEEVATDENLKDGSVPCRFAHKSATVKPSPLTLTGEELKCGESFIGEY